MKSNKIRNRCVSANIAAQTDKNSAYADFLIRTLGFLFDSSRANFFFLFVSCVLIQLSRTSFSIIHLEKKNYEIEFLSNSL